MCLSDDDALVVLHAQVLHDELAAVGTVLPHVEPENTVGVEVLVQDDGVEAHVLIDKPFEFVGRNLAQTLKAGDFGVAGAVYGNARKNSGFRNTARSGRSFTTSNVVLI